MAAKIGVDTAENEPEVPNSNDTCTSSSEPQRTMPRCASSATAVCSAVSAPPPCVGTDEKSDAGLPLSACQVAKKDLLSKLRFEVI